MTERQDELLNRFVDGVLSESEAVEFESMVTKDPALASLKEDFAKIGPLLRADIEHELDQIDFTDFSAQVNARIDVEEQSAVSIAEANSISSSDSSPELVSSPGLGERLAAWWSAQWQPLMVGAAAAAAVAFFMVGNESAKETAEGGQRGPAIAASSGDSMSKTGTSPSGQNSGSQGAAPASGQPGLAVAGTDVQSSVQNDAVQPAKSPSGVVIDSVSFEGPKTVLVSMPLQEGEDTVIWLLDEEENLEPVEGEDPI